jgi:hypothetical protein
LARRQQWKGFGLHVVAIGDTLMLKRCLLSLAIVIPALSIVCVSANGDEMRQAVYQSAFAPKMWALDSLIKQPVKMADTPPPYIVHSGKVYLLLQVTWPGQVMATEVRFEEWTSKKLNEVFNSEALRKLLPDPAAENGGIAWIKHSNKPKQ